MKLLFACAVFATVASAALTKPVASYNIQASLDTKTHIITGTETLTWHNDSPDSVPTLRLHLYMNAFRNERSTFFKESGGQLRGDEFKGTEWGWAEIRKMTLEDGADVTKAIAFIHPDDGNAEDRTVVEVKLPEAVKPGSTVKVRIEFQTKLPMVFARTGFHKDFYLGGQWFPKLGVWETAGFRYSKQGAWNCHQFHANSEFFANFGDYHVELTVPEKMVVGATGEQKARTVKDGRATYVFEQEGVTDFAWTAQPNYVREERMFVAAKETTAAEIAAVAKLHNIPESEAQLSDVKMIALVQPEHREQMERHFEALRTAIKGFGLRYGRYPYKTITVVDPPYGAAGAGGMEYPTFITAGTSWRLAPESHMLEMVTVHEFGHQFWMQLVASNEFEESWLDEGFNTYSTTQIMEQRYGGIGQLPVRLFGANLWGLLQLPGLNGINENRSGYLSEPVTDDLVRRAWEYYSGSSYSVNSYMRTGVTLETLERVLGKPVMDRMMRVYHQRWRFRHPTSRDFEQVANEVSGRDLKWFFDQFVFGSRLLDYQVGSVRNARVETPIGLFEKNGKLEEVTRAQAEAADEKLDKDKNYKPRYECTVKIRRLGADRRADPLQRRHDGEAAVGRAVPLGEVHVSAELGD